MKLFDVYPLFDIKPVKALGSYIWDDKGQKYLDLYGGHAVISVGHSHPHYISRLSNQLENIAFYSNSVVIPQQEELANLLGRLSGYIDYQLFLCNSGAEANENALKLASFHTGKTGIIACNKSFHGRTSLAVAATDDPKISAPVNHTDYISFVPLNDIQALESAMNEGIAAIIVEGIQGVGGIYTPSQDFLSKARQLCDQYGALLILDEVQSGYGRTGKFFAHQWTDVKPDIITIAKGMGNGFPVAGVLIHPNIKPKHSMLGTTFGGNYLACAAAIAVLEIMEQEQLMPHTLEMGNYIISQLQGVKGIKEIRGTGLMLGIELEVTAGTVRKYILEHFHIFTGAASQPNTIRILPALNVSREACDAFIHALKETLKTI